MTSSLRPSLLVEDSPKDLELSRAALARCKLANPIEVARDGAEALEYLRSVGPWRGRDSGDPAVVLLDLKLPKVDGLEVLREVKNDPALRTVPVVMLTSSREEKDVVGSSSGGVNAYVVKPVEFDQFVKALRELGLFWAVLNEPPPGSVPKVGR